LGDLKEIILTELSTIQREGMNDLIDYISNKTDYFTAPASTNYHSNYEGGLAEHSHKVTQLFREKNERFSLGLSEDTIKICGYCHDWCKCCFYIKGKKNVKEGKKPDGRDNWIEKEIWEIDDKLPLGHGEKSIILLQRFIPLSTEEVMIIRWHMGIPEDYMSKKSYEKATEKYKSIIAFHSSDLESSYLLEEIKK
jgi:hypothetical protein